MPPSDIAKKTHSRLFDRTAGSRPLLFLFARGQGHRPSTALKTPYFHRIGEDLLPGRGLNPAQRSQGGCRFFLRKFRTLPVSGRQTLTQPASPRRRQLRAMAAESEPISTARRMAGPGRSPRRINLLWRKWVAGMQAIPCRSSQFPARRSRHYSLSLIHI